MYRAADLYSCAALRYCVLALLVMMMMLLGQHHRDVFTSSSQWFCSTCMCWVHCRCGFFGFVTSYLRTAICGHMTAQAE